MLSVHTLRRRPLCRPTLQTEHGTQSTLRHHFTRRAGDLELHTFRSGAVAGQFDGANMDEYQLPYFRHRAGVQLLHLQLLGGKTTLPTLVEVDWSLQPAGTGQAEEAEGVQVDTGRYAYIETTP